jgi:DNA invertase Pin-like site-specific DNA recombinase
MFRAVIFAAVSTRTQAGPDKASLEEQVAACRAWLASQSIAEAHEPLVVRGASRDYVSIRDAEREIPELAALLDLAQARSVNLIVVKNLDRFRRIMEQLRYSLALYRAQLYSLSQPVELVAPEKFSGGDSDAGAIITGMSQIVSNTETANRVRRWRAGMPSRIERGLPWHRIPYGYRKPAGRETDRKAVPEQDAAECAVIRRMKSEYLGGQSQREIADGLARDGIPAPAGRSWQASTVIRILENPFYAGLVHYGAERTYRDPRSGRKVRESTGGRILARGAHRALWSESVLERIMARHEALGCRLAGRPKHRYSLSCLVVCDECGSLAAHSTGGGRSLFRCKRGPGHLWAFEDDLLPVLRDRLAELAARLPAEAADPEPEEDDASHQLAQLADRRARYQRAYGEGAMSLDDLRARMAELDAARRELSSQRGRRARRAAGAENRAALARLLAEWDGLAGGDGAAFNARLMELVEAVVVRWKTIVEIQLR